MLLVFSKLCYCQIINDNDSLKYSKSMKDSLDFNRGIKLNERETKKNAKFFLKKNFGWKTYFFKKPYKTKFIDNSSYFYSSSFNKNKRFVITTMS